MLAIGVRAARRLIVGIVGGTVMVVGVALLVLPGPALVVIPVGLGILAVEFEWARRWLRAMRDATNASLASGTRGPVTPNDAARGKGGDGSPRA